MRSASLLICLVGVLPWTSATRGQEPPCAAALERPDELVAALSAAQAYASTYVMVFHDRLTGTIAGIDSPALGALAVGIHTGTAAEVLAEEAGLVDTRTYSAAPTELGSPVRDLLAGQIDAAVLWAPIAGMGLLEHDVEQELSLLIVGPPSAPPGAFVATAPAPGDACAAEIVTLLQAYGVVPAEKLVPLDIRDFLDRTAPPPDRADLETGALGYAQRCARCHGENAVAAPEALAPVDLLRSVRRLTYPGFLYISLNGRQARGMPGFQGFLKEENMRPIFQYVRQRSFER